MRYSQAFIPTQKEVPKDATAPSHILLLRAGYARMVGAGIYALLPLGLRVLQKISAIVREEMNRAGAQELLLPALLPADYLRESGRWDTFGQTLLRLRDRKGSDYLLGPTHEEIITDLARREVNSYRQLPLNLYQLQMKYRDEPRPRAGLLRCREFLMKDAYSFDVSEDAARESYERMREAYQRIFQRLGLETRLVAADSGAMGGSTSAEFQVLAQTGEDAIVACSGCDYAANLEVARAQTPSGSADTALRDTLKASSFSTPGVRSIDQLVDFLRAHPAAIRGAAAASADRCLKSIVVFPGAAVDGDTNKARSPGTLASSENSAPQATLIVLVGSDVLNEVAAARALGVAEVRLATDREVFDAMGAPSGAVGPVGFSGPILIDRRVPLAGPWFTGANQKETHLQDVCYGRDFEGQVADLRLVQDGDACPRCGQPLRGYRGIEGGHIFILGTHYSDKMGATFLDEAGQQKSFVMGCYGIGVSRLVSAAIEQHHDEAGIRWPVAIAPFAVVITPIGKDDEAVTEAAESLYAALRATTFQGAPLDVLLDDRNERPGVKFKDADLLGIPVRVVIGQRGLAQGELELKLRSAEKPVMVPVDAARDRIVALLRDSQT